jgi:hypothetical protein
VCGNECALKLGNRRKCQPHASADEPLAKIVRLAIYIGGCVGANSRPGHFGEEPNLLHLPGIEPGLLALPTDDQITILTELSLIILHIRTYLQRGRL